MDMHDIAALILAVAMVGFIAIQAKRRADEVNAMTEEEREEERDISIW